ncbi:MAG: acyl carrier protein [Acidobacteriia bacterium]|nr:acyl carrier protein [Terriglobia bacterium]
MDKQSRITEIVRRVAGKPVVFAPEDSLFESGLLDSFSLTDLVTSLETEFSVRIPDSDLNPRKFDSVERIRAYLDSRR